MRRTRLVSLALLLAVLSLPVWACAESGDGRGVGAPIAAGELAARLGGDDAPLVLDVRSPAEFAAGHVPGAINIPHDQLAARLAELPIDARDELVVHCQRGGRAARAAALLHEAGYQDVRDLEGHWQAWQAAGLPVAR